MNKIVALLSLIFVSTTVVAFTHKNCLVSVGSSVSSQVLDVLINKGFTPVLADRANDGDLGLEGGVNCRDEVGFFKWQVCDGTVYLSSMNAGQKSVKAIGKDRKELNFEFTWRYPRAEALLGAIQKLPSCATYQ